METVLMVLGLLVGAVSGYFIGKYSGYYSLNRKNTFGNFENPELDEIEDVKKRNTMGKGDKIVLAFGMLFLFALGALLIRTGLELSGVVKASITESKNVHVGGSAGMMYCAGGFALFMGFLMLYGLITGDVKKG